MFLQPRQQNSCEQRAVSELLECSKTIKVKQISSEEAEEENICPWPRQVKYTKAARYKGYRKQLFAATCTDFPQSSHPRGKFLPETAKSRQMRDKAPTAESFSHSRDLPQRTLKRIPQFKLCEQYALSNVVNLTRELELIHNHKKQMLLQKQRGHRLKTVS